MNRKIPFIVVILFSIISGILLYYILQKTTPPSKQSDNQQIMPAQKLPVGQDIKIVGTVVENVVKSSSLDGPAYLNIRTDQGAQIRVTYSPGEAECKNMASSRFSFSVKAGTRVEVFAKVISANELFTCDSVNYYIKGLATIPNPKNSMNNLTPTMPPLSSQTALQKNIDDCNLISNSYFRTVNQYEVGLGPNGPVMGYWDIQFQKGTTLTDYGKPTFLWRYSDVSENGTYTCKNNVLQAKLLNRSVGARYDRNQEILIWDNIEYKRAK